MSLITSKFLWVAVRAPLASLLAIIVTGVKLVLGSAMACSLLIILVIVLWGFYITSGIDFDEVGPFLLSSVFSSPITFFPRPLSLCRAKVANKSGMGLRLVG